MPNEAYSASVVREVLKAQPQSWIWKGNRSWIIWFLDRFAPRSVWVCGISTPPTLISANNDQDWIFPSMFGLTRLRQIIVKRKSV
jgi:hypothetical protein